MSTKKTFVRDGKPLDVRVTHEADNVVRAFVGERSYDLVAEPLPGGGVRITHGGKTMTAHVALRGQRMQVRLDGQTYDLPIARGRGAGAAGGGSGEVEAPMTGTVLDVKVKVGDEVAADQVVAVLSAMKMEHKLTAGVIGKVVEVNCKPGAIVDQGKVLVKVAPIKA